MRAVLACLILNAALAAVACAGEAPRAQGWLYVQAEHFTWREYVGGRRLLREAGPRFGIGGEAMYAVNDLVPLRLRGDIGFGGVDYSGSTMDGDSIPVRTTTDYVTFRVDGDVGWRLKIDQALVEPFVGVGFRSWSRDLNDTTVVTGGGAEPVYGYLENWRSTYVYSGLRVRTPDLPARKGLFVEAAWKYPLSTRNEVSAFDVRVKPGGRGVPYVEAGGWYRHVQAGIYYDRLYYGRSAESGGLFQPKSEADLIGFKLGYRF